MKDRNFKLITKYALLLSVFHVLAYAFGRAIIDFELIESGYKNIAYRNMITLLFSVLLNIITAYFVAQDVKKFQVKTKYVTLATIVYRPLGVFSFLLFLFLQNDNADN